MPTYTNVGSTLHFEMQYDDALNVSVGQGAATALIEHAEADFNQLKAWFGGLEAWAGKATISINAGNEPGGGTGATWSGVGGSVVLVPGFAANDSTVNVDPWFLRYLLVSEISEMFMAAQDRDWYGGSWSPGGNEGSAGEALSRFLGEQLLIVNGVSDGTYSGYEITNAWLGNSPRQDFVNNVNPALNGINPHTGCAMAFLYYLFAQLKFSINDIVGAGAQELARVYTNLTDDFDDPFPHFLRLIDAAYPGTNKVTGSNLDNPFPIVQQMQITCIFKPDKASTTDHIVSVGGKNHTLGQTFNMSQESCKSLLNGMAIQADAYGYPAGAPVAMSAPFIAGGNYRFYVVGGGSTADVAVFYHDVPGPDNDQRKSYIATVPDRTTADNLLSLPQC